MTFVTGLISMGSIKPQYISRRANDDGLDLYHISTPTGSNVSEFFDSVRSTLPLDPPLVSNNWDAFIDSLDSGVADLESPGAVIIWADAHNLSRVLPDDSRVAMACLARVTEHVADSDQTSRPKILSVFVNIDQGDYWADRWPYVVLSNEFL